MEVKKINFLKSYSSVLLLLGGIIIGSIFGLVFKEKVAVIKPVGDIFLNFLFTAIIPLVFFNNYFFNCQFRENRKVRKAICYHDSSVFRDTFDFGYSDDYSSLFFSYS